MAKAWDLGDVVKPRCLCGAVEHNPNTCSVCQEEGYWTDTRDTIAWLEGHRDRQIELHNYEGRIYEGVHHALRRQQVLRYVVTVTTPPEWGDAENEALIHQADELKIDARIMDTMADLVALLPEAGLLQVEVKDDD